MPTSRLLLHDQRLRKKTELRSRFDILRWMLGSALDSAAKETLA